MRCAMPTFKGALVGSEAVTPEGLKAVYKDFNFSGDRLVQQLQTFRKHGLHVLGSFIFGPPTDKPSTFRATVELALKADVTFAQFVMMTPFPGTADFGRWVEVACLGQTFIVEPQPHSAHNAHFCKARQLVYGCANAWYVIR